jgi:hypothetical protein
MSVPFFTNGGMKITILSSKRKYIYLNPSERISTFKYCNFKRNFPNSNASYTSEAMKKNTDSVLVFWDKNSNPGTNVL